MLIYCNVHLQLHLKKRTVFPGRKNCVMLLVFDSLDSDLCTVYSFVSNLDIVRFVHCSVFV